MKLLLVAGSFYPAFGYGGPIEANSAMCRVLASLGADVRVLTTNTNGRRRLPADFLGWRHMDGYEVFYADRWLWRDLSPSLALHLLGEVPRADVVHATGTYNWFLPAVAEICRRFEKPLVVSPRASLLPAARGEKALKKRLFDRLAQRRALSLVSVFHATSDGEAAEVRAHVPGARTAVIPNGVETPPAIPEAVSPLSPYLLYVGRLHPYKRVDTIIRAFDRATGLPGLKQWRLAVAGDGDPRYRRELESLAARPGLSGRVQFLGHVGGLEKSRLLAQAGFVVQAPKPENFGNVVTEALAHGTPVLVGQGLPWAALDEKRCGCWVEDSEEGLAEGMTRLMRMSRDERHAMGERGRSWTATTFSWSAVGTQMLALYETLAHHSSQSSA